MLILLIFPLYFVNIGISQKYKGKIRNNRIAYLSPKMKFSRNTFHMTLMYSKSLFYKSTLRILKKNMGRGLWGPPNPKKLEKWVKIQTSGHSSWVKKNIFKASYSRIFHLIYIFSDSGVKTNFLKQF